MARTPRSPRIVDALKHADASRINIPTAEMESFFRRDEDTSPKPPIHYPRARPLAHGTTRTDEEPSKPELIWNGATITITDEQMQELADTGRLTLSDAQLVWRGKDRQDWSDLVVNVPPLYIQEKIHPKAIIDDLKRRTAANREAATDAPDLFADFNGIEPDQRAEFYQHDQHWSNRMILGDSLQVMASLAERESLRGKVQCIYFDPPYGIKFNSNWQVSTQSRDVKDGKQADISREPEQVKAFRDTWKDGIHSYLTYLRDRLTAMRDLLTQSGSIFVQIGDENVHRVRAVMDEVFGAANLVSQITFQTTTGRTNSNLAAASNYILWFARDEQHLKFRSPLRPKSAGASTDQVYRSVRREDGSWYKLRADQNPLAVTDGRLFTPDNITSSRPAGEGDLRHFLYEGQRFPSGKGTFKTDETGLVRLAKASRIWKASNSIRYVRYLDDFDAIGVSNVWTDTQTGNFTDDKVYVVQTASKVIERCMLMATDPGDLVLDPTCGSGTSAYVAEQWGRRWITMDTSRVALALARTRMMAARYPWYLLADSREGRSKEAALTQRPQPDTPVRNDIRQGFVYDRVPHITLKSIANNPLIDDIWEKWQAVLEPRRAELNQLVGKDWQEWEIPREPDKSWSDNVRGVHKAWWEARMARQTAIDASIAARAEVEYLYDKPYADNNRVRVAGPFTVESLSPHRVLPASEEELIDDIAAAEGRRSAADADLAGQDFAAIVIDYLRTEGVKQQDKDDRITFDSLMPWPGGKFIGASGTFIEGENGPERRAAILIGPEYGTVGRQDIVAAAREAVDARFDVLIACAFNFDAHSSELGSLGSLRILKARINPDMHMSEELKNTGRGNMFVVFGEPDVDILDDGGPQIRVKVNGVDVFDPNTGDIRSDDTAGIAAWFVDTDYNEESFFVRHAYFLGANDPYKGLRTALKADIDEDAWATLYSDTSRPFERPATGKIAVKVINHFGDEVMKVFGV
ncbi:site-specific DNA-methyltransferase [Rhizobium leguminosarum]|uniref:site-specific DNA-methyltransferase n=1 Tax=Rhizobium leguminosarum TaxID=384 RepID=UPI001A92DBB7|nr:site-specific DNA-methyltransferase [Rhizobium leguminosarum]MBY5554140.1 site-specific DNA-methyltransferase [Rhizobium leguminosarum]MBY5723566.1 site-specific DNA-methyltransferase [Rhizobium leguminosarum]QSW27259.1 site-specific DNA-methyltransferase [Rhizobium leguminosarum]